MSPFLGRRERGGSFVVLPICSQVLWPPFLLDSTKHARSQTAPKVAQFEFFGNAGRDNSNHLIWYCTVPVSACKSRISIRGGFYGALVQIHLDDADSGHSGYRGGARHGT